MGKKKGKESFRLSFQDWILGLTAMAVAGCGTAYFLRLVLRYTVTIHVFFLCFSVLIFLIIGGMLFWKKNEFNRDLSIFAIISVLIFFLVALLVPWQINSCNSRYYDREMRYLTEKHFTTQFFPEEIPGGISDYHFRFEPGILGLKSYATVGYTCPTQVLSDYRKDIRKNAIIGPMSLNSAREKKLGPTYRAQIAEICGVEMSELGNVGLTIAFPDNIDDHKDALVYVMSCDYKDGVVKTEVILVDITKDWVCFSKYY